RQARERSRFMAQQMLAMGGQNVNIDLSEILYDMDLSDADRQATDGAMTSYENRLTMLLGKLYKSVTGMMMDMFDAMEKAGFAEQNVEDPETMQKMGETMQNIWADLTRKTMALAAEVSELNHKTAKSVPGLLSNPVTGRAFVHRYYERAYPEAGFSF